MRGLPQALRHRDYALLWSGQTISVVGDGIYTIAIALEALRISNHARTLAYVEAARVAPNALFLIFAGALVDRLPRRLVVLGANVSRGGAVAVLAALGMAHALNLTELVVLSAVVGVGDAFFYPAYRAIMAELLPADLLIQGNAAEAIPPEALPTSLATRWPVLLRLVATVATEAGALPAKTQRTLDY